MSSDHSPKNQPDLREARDLAHALLIAAEDAEAALCDVINDFDFDRDDDGSLDRIWSALEAARDATISAEYVARELQSIPQLGSESSTTATASEAAE